MLLPIPAPLTKVAMSNAILIKPFQGISLLSIFMTLKMVSGN